MKPLTLALTAAVGAAFVVSSTAAFAQDRQHSSHMTARRTTSHVSRGSSYTSNSGGYRNYRGHRLSQRNGHWGYYQPRNGTQIWITIPL